MRLDAKEGALELSAKIPRGCCPVGRLVRAGPANIRPEAEHTGLSTVQVYRGSMSVVASLLRLYPLRSSEPHDKLCRSHSRASRTEQRSYCVQARSGSDCAVDGS